MAVAERELFRSIDKVNELYVYLLAFLQELADSDRNDADDLHLRFFPNQEQAKASRRLFDLKFNIALGESKEYKNQIARMNISWQTEQDLIRKNFLELKKSELYSDFLKDNDASEKDFLVEVVRKFIENSEALANHIDEKNIFWSDDFEFTVQLVIRTIRNFYEKNTMELIPLYKDEIDDVEFVRKLFTQTILNNKVFEEDISERTKNWEIERIALMDILILKMALAELISFPNIPVKVSINEFIDISKEYSTPKSKQFVNGVIDKLATDYKEKGKIVKAGRGLIN